jgi:hypothetical protein
MKACTALKSWLQQAGIKIICPRPAWIVAPLLPAICAIAAAGIASATFNIGTHVFTRDMAVLTKVPPYVSFVSTMAMLYWCATCAISAFAAIVTQNCSARERGFLIASSALTFWLLVDDVFLFHDHISAEYLNIPESGVYGFYVFITCAYLLNFRRTILDSGVAWILGASLGFFAVSAGIDQLFEDLLRGQIGHWEFLIEDGAKLIGLTFWLSFHALMAYTLVRGSFPQSPANKQS